MISKLEASFIEKIISLTTDKKITWSVYTHKNDTDSKESSMNDYKSYLSNSLQYEERFFDDKIKDLITKKMRCVFRIERWYRNINLICGFVNGDDYTISNFSIGSSDEKSIEYRMLNRLFDIVEDYNNKKVEADKLNNISSFMENFK